MNGKELETKDKIALREYGFAEKLRESYFTNSWVATSIILPVSFGLVGLSYTGPVVHLDCLQLLPLALVSMLLYTYWLWYISRYSGYLDVVFTRMREIELVLGMSLHRKIHEKLHGQFLGCLRRVKTLNYVTFVVLFFIWALRLCF
jgi:hypothetical protein